MCIQAYKARSFFCFPLPNMKYKLASRFKWLRIPQYPLRRKLFLQP